MNKELNYEEIVKKVEEMKKGKNLDLSTEEDLAIAIMGGLFFAIAVNLYIMPLFFYFIQKKGESEYYQQ